MGHRRFYNFLLAAMGNLVSTILMFVLRAAWLCQRLIDRDYRQNHGSRLRPVGDGTTASEPVEIEFVLPRAHACKSKLLRPNPKTKGLEMPKYQIESPRKSGECKKRQNRCWTDTWLTSSHPCLEGQDFRATTFHYVNGLSTSAVLRRAFSDINLNPGCSEFQVLDNQKYLSNGSLSDATVPMTDQDFLRFIFTKGYVT